MTVSGGDALAAEQPIRSAAPAHDHRGGPRTKDATSGTRDGVDGAV
jgi:hypothetical protein